LSDAFWSKSKVAQSGLELRIRLKPSPIANGWYQKSFDKCSLMILFYINPLTPELNPSAQRCMTRFFNGDFAS
jgi:hypothetical protein